MGCPPFWVAAEAKESIASETDVTSSGSDPERLRTKVEAVCEALARGKTLIPYTMRNLHTPALRCLHEKRDAQNRRICVQRLAPRALRTPQPTAKIKQLFDFVDLLMWARVGASCSWPEGLTFTLGPSPLWHPGVAAHTYVCAARARLLGAPDVA